MARQSTGPVKGSRIARAALSWAKSFDDLRRSGRRAAIHFYPAGFDKESPRASVSLGKKRFAFGEGFFCQAFFDGGEICFREFAEKRNLFEENGHKLAIG